MLFVDVTLRELELHEGGLPGLESHKKRDDRLYPSDNHQSREINTESGEKVVQDTT